MADDETVKEVRVAEPVVLADSPLVAVPELAVESVAELVPAVISNSSD